MQFFLASWVMLSRLAWQTSKDIHHERRVTLYGYMAGCIRSIIHEYMMVCSPHACDISQHAVHICTQLSFSLRFMSTHLIIRFNFLKLPIQNIHMDMYLCIIIFRYVVSLSNHTLTISLKVYLSLDKAYNAPGMPRRLKMVHSWPKKSNLI